MIFYHRTTEDRWKQILNEGILWGYRIHNNIPTLDYRYTYLSPEDMGDSYGDVLLEVKYDPVGIDGNGIDNYVFEHQIPKEHKGEYCWQFSVFVPISIEKITRIK